jgi:phenylacetate-CoA ligase
MTVDLYAEFIRRMIHPAVMIKRGKTRIYKYLKEFDTSQYLDGGVIRDRQWDRLKKLISHAYESSDFYKTRFEEAGLRPSNIQSFSDYCKVPLLLKKDIQDNLAALTSKRYRTEELVPNRTGGSTGMPLHYFHDKERILSMEAAAIRHFRWAGHDIGEKIAVIWGSRRDLSRSGEIKSKLWNFLLERALILDSSSMSEETLDRFVKDLLRFKPKTIQAYAKSIYFFAQYCKERGIEGIHPQSIVTSAEMLLEPERRLVEEVFQCKVFDFYGSREVSVIASECEEHSGLHVNADALYVEFVDDAGRPVAPGQQGNIVITDLFNYGMPFLRYKIEDIGIPSDRVCRCGRGLPLMEMVAGRTTDFILTPHGLRVSGAALTIYLISSVPGIRQAQIVQDEIDHLNFRIVPDPEFNREGLAVLKEKVPEFFGSEMRYDITFMEEIPKDPSGKFRFSISNIKTFSR